MNVRKVIETALFRLCKVLVVGATLATFADTVVAQQASSGQIIASTPPVDLPAAKKSHKEHEGERVFAENCSRCHTAPDSFSPRITRTVVRHMRVRASLSERDEKALLQFFNPQ